MIALLGNLARDLFPPPRHGAAAEARTGGAPLHAGRALALLGAPARVYARCALADADALLMPLRALPLELEYVPGKATASFAIREHDGGRELELLALGDRWLPADLPALPADAGFVHVAPLTRGEFPPETLAALARGRVLSLDGQGLVRPARLGPVALDADYDPALLEHVGILKLSDEEAAALGDPWALDVPELIVTHGPLGATLRSGGRVEEIPARVVGGTHTGTGDAFAAGYLAWRAAGEPPGAAARAAAALVARGLEASA